MTHFTAPEYAWDERNSVFLRRYGSTSELDHTPGVPYEFLISSSAPKTLELLGLYIPNRSSTLIVTLHGSLDRAKFSLPRFEWRATLAPVNAVQLFLADTTLALSDDMALSWYCGNQTQDLIEDLSVLVTDLAREGGYSNVILTGSSGGGFASLAISRKIPESVAVCFSPQTHILNYYSKVVNIFLENAFPDIPQPVTGLPNYSIRFDLIELYRTTPDINYVRFVQNTSDKFHFSKHYSPFAAAQGVKPSAGGLSPSGRMEFILEEQRDGHHPPLAAGFLKNIFDAHKTFRDTSLEMREDER